MLPQIIEIVEGQSKPLSNTGLLPKFVELGKALNLPRPVETIEISRDGNDVYVQAGYIGGTYAGSMGYSPEGRFMTGGAFIKYVPVYRSDKLYNPAVPHLVAEIVPHVPAGGVLRAVGLRVRGHG